MDQDDIIAEESGHVWEKRFGCLFDPTGPDAQRARLASFKFSLQPRRGMAALPSHVDLRDGFPPVTEQRYNSCTAESLSAAYSHALTTHGGTRTAPYDELSRLFLYYQERLMEGNTQEDAGAQIYSGILVLMTSGIAEEKHWPYTAGTSTKPPTVAYANALDHKVVSAKLVEQDIDTFRTTLASGHPIVGGFLVYPSIKSPLVDATGDIQIPTQLERRGRPISGHAIVIVGYDDTSQRFFIRNSWGTGWGKQGYGSLPYAYVLDPYLCRDNWVIQSVNDRRLIVPPPPPANTTVVECCTTCNPESCCCARTRALVTGHSHNQQQPPETMRRARRLLRDLIGFEGPGGKTHGQAAS